MTESTISFNPLTFPYPINEEDLVVHFTYQGIPLAKGRPRFTGKRRVYTDEKTRNYEQTLSLLLRNALKEKTIDDTSRFALRCLFYRTTRQRIDCDNLLKAVSDAATGVIWKDDSQVAEIFGRLFLASEIARIEIVIYKVADTAPRPVCEFCGASFITFPSVGSHFCSIHCANQSKRVKKICRFCLSEFEIPRSVDRGNQGFCSRRCSARFYGARKTNYRGRHTWKCVDCGGAVSRKEYERCRSCSTAHRQEPTSNYWKLRHKSVGTMTNK